MSMVKNIEIDGKQVPFRASAAIPRIYRMKFQRDIYKDLASLEKAIDSNSEEVSNLDLFSLEMFENSKEENLDHRGAVVMCSHVLYGSGGSGKEDRMESNKRKNLLL